MRLDSSDWSELEVEISLSLPWWSSTLAWVDGRLLALAGAGLLPRPRPFPRARPGTETGLSGSDFSVSVELMTGD